MGGAVGISADQRRAAAELLESVVGSIAAGDDVPFRSVEFGPGSDRLGFNVRRGSLLVEYQTRTNALEETPKLSGAGGGLVDISRHVPLRDAGERFARLEESVVDIVADAVPAVPVPEALNPVTVWPVADEAGLYLVGFDVRRKRFLYSAAFRIPASAMR